MSFSILCKTISLFVLIFYTGANELNVLREPRTQVVTTSSQDNNLALPAGSTSATSTLIEGVTDAEVLQQHDQDPSNPDVLLLASENPDCAASSSNIIHSPAGKRKIKRLRAKRSDGGVCEWQEFKDDSPGTTTTPEVDQRLSGKRRRPKPGVAKPGRDVGPIGPLLNPEQPSNLGPAPYKLDSKSNPQKCPFGQQNIPVCYPKAGPPQNDPALFLSPCRIGKCNISLCTLWSVRTFCRSTLPSRQQISFLAKQCSGKIYNITD